MLHGDTPPDPLEPGAQPPDIKRPGRCILLGCTQQDVIGFMAAKHVVDEVGVHRHLALRLLLAGKAPLDQAGDDRGIPVH
jgi:capsular polysaccharide biosynthesis protein